MKNNFAEILEETTKATQKSADVIAKSLRVMSERIFASYVNQLAEDWCSHTEEEKIEIAKSVAGAYNLSDFLTMMEIKSRKTN